MTPSSSSPYQHPVQCDRGQTAGARSDELVGGAEIVVRAKDIHQLHEQLEAARHRAGE